MRWLTTIAIVMSIVLFSGAEIVASGDVSTFRLPFEREDPYVITQGPRCNVSHNSGQNLEAIDISMEEGTPIYASEGGTAVYINEGSRKGGNVVHIVHPNGLKSIYAHLSRPNPKEPYVPSTVKIGDLIGLSGSTGNVFGPHLHFAVVRDNDDGTSTPIPIWQMPGIAWNPIYDGKEYPASGWCDVQYSNQGSAQWPPPGVMSLVRSEFTVERTSPSLSEEVMFSTKLENNGEVPVYLRNVFLRLRKGDSVVNVFGLQANQGTVVIQPGESRRFCK